MDGNGITRVDLLDGNWADVRTKRTVGHMRIARKRAAERGYEDEILDGFHLIIEGWSLGDVTDDAIDSLDAEDAAALTTAANAGKDDGAPNSSESSSNGGDASPTSAGNRRSRGNSG